MFQATPRSVKHHLNTLACVITTLVLGLGVSAGCNLSVELDNYPYITILDGDQQEDLTTLPDMKMPDQDLAEMPGEEMGPKDMPPDMPKPKLGVRLIFTEVMIKTSKRGNSGNSEPGEYIEIANVGDEPAELRRVQIRLDTSTVLVLRVDLGASPDAQEQAQYDAIALLQPGEHFVFVRDDDADFGITQGLPLGSFFEWHWSQPMIALANTTRQLTLAYDRPMGLSFQDVISWSGEDLVDQGTMMADEAYPVTQDVAFMLDERFYSAQGNDSVTAWCLAAEIIPGNTGMRGTPGRSGMCSPN